MSEEILGKIDFNTSDAGHSFEYDSESGFLRDDQGVYLLFRAETPGSQPSLRAQGELDENKTASYGKGLYTGNTPESVAPYTWVRPDTVINTYITPALDEGAVYNHARLSGHEAVKEYTRRARARKALGWHAVSQDFDIIHGAALLATIDAGLDISVGQKLLSVTRHVAPPRWGVWRGSDTDLQHVGVATADSKPHKWAVKAARHSAKR